MNQWFDETLVAIKAFRGKYKVLELPARSSGVHSSHRYFSTPELAEAYIEREYGHTKTITVQPEDITEEQARRFATEIKETEQEEDATSSKGQGIEYTVDLGGGKKRVQHTRRFVW